jgi:putative drug exporter of the RND superfamily
MFGRLARVVVHNPWKVIGIWVLVAAALVAFGPKLGDVTNSDQTSFLPSKYEAAQASKLSDEAFPRSDNASALLVFKRADGGKLTAADRSKVDQVAQKLSDDKIKRVLSVTAMEGASANGKIMLATAQIDGTTSDKQVPDAVKDLRADTKPLMSGSDLKVGYTGEAALLLDNQDAFGNAEKIVGFVTIILIIVLLLLIYRSPVAALLPILCVGLVSLVSQPVIALVAKGLGLDVDQSVPIILTVVLFGIGTDYILFLLFRYRERLRAGDDEKQAMIVAVTRVGEAIASAAGAVIIAFGTMLLASLGSFRSLGPGLAVAVFVMAVSALTLVPAVVSLLGTKVFWPSKGWRKQPKGALPHRIGQVVGRRPAATAIVSGVVMIALASGVFGFKADYDQLSQLPKDTESSRSMTDMQSAFPAGLENPTEVYVSSTTGKPLDRAAVESFATSLKGKNSIADITAIPPAVGAPKGTKATHAVYSKDGRIALVKAVLGEDPFSNQALDVINPMRDTAHAQAPAGTKVLVGGATASYTDVRSATDRDMGVIFPIAGLLIALILGLLLRSVVAPWYLMLAVVLGFAGTLGSTVWLFQTLLGHTGVMFMLPILIYMFVVAIGTDYNILMVARLREEAKEGHEPREAAALAVEHAGPSIASAGVILAGTFASLMLASVSLLTEMGFAVSVGICISAFVMSMFLVPSVTALVGHRAWWPGNRGGAGKQGGSGTRDEPEREPQPVGTR